MTKSSISSLIIALLLIIPFQIIAQAPIVEITRETTPPSVEQQLVRLSEALVKKEKERGALEKASKAEEDELTQLQLQQDILAAEDIILGLREEIVSLATGGIKLFVEQPEENENFNWEQDLERIFEPLLIQLREISERPRLIEKLESNITFWEKREEKLLEAVKNLEANREVIQVSQVKKQLDELLGTANTRLNSAQQKLELLRSELNTTKESDNPIWSIANDMFSEFIIDMILHLLIALIAAFIAYQLIKLLCLLLGRFIKLFKSIDAGLIDRSISIAHIVIGSLISLAIYFVILYSLTEWFLLLLSLLIVAGLILGLKDAIPAYLNEIKTLLNMGTIRQGERFVYDGLPWKIKRLNVHTHLHNPLLHGHLRVPLSEIVNQSSRPYHKDEPWFPTAVGDFVFLHDQIFGKIIRQTPEIVEVDVGGSVYTYLTTEFLSSAPRNFSRQGFSIYEIFGFDYQHQDTIINTMLNTYLTAIEKAVKQAPFGDYCTRLTIEFNQAAASSLDYKILISFEGKAAEYYFAIRRLLQKTSVEVANTHGWVIPFNQLTVHHQPAD